MNRPAFLILAHTDPEQFSRLVKRLSGWGAIYVHIDAKSKENNFRELVADENVHFVRERVSVYWGDISMIKAQNKLIHAAIQTNEKYTYLVFLSGSCYPVKPLDYICKFLEASRAEGKEFVNFFDIRESRHHKKHIYKKWFMNPIYAGKISLIKKIDKKLRSLLNRMHLPNYWNKKYVPCFGSQWIALSHECAEYILDFQLKETSFMLMNYHTFSPDEHYYHTIIANSNYCKNSGGFHRHQGRGGNWKMSNLHIIRKAGSKYYSLKDWGNLYTSDKLFVRKVGSNCSEGLLNKIDQYIHKCK